MSMKRALPIGLLALLWLLVTLPAHAVTPVKSPNDSRNYESFKLPNKLRVLLISDPTSDKAAAALDVHVGSASEPDSRPGLAHFLEHMLFLGTKKYPQPGAYNQFLNAHGGDHNAYTAFDNTNFFFDVDAHYLKPALDRFAQFFIAPLFTAKYVSNERQVVHSEYQSDLGSDSWRISSAQRLSYNPAHPASRFSIGSKTTLADRPGDEVREDLIHFYRTHYSANLMTLVVLGKEPLGTLKQWVTATFSAVPNHNVSALKIKAPLFRSHQLPERLNVIPLKDQQRLTLSFPVPPAKPYFRTKPLDYIANLLGHEGTGSLLWLLKKRGWADSLWAGASNDYVNRGLFSVSIDLTDSGLAHANDIIGLVFRELQLIRDHGIVAWRYQEQSRLAQINFRFQKRSAPLGAVRRLAANMQYYPLKDVLSGPDLMTQYDPALIQRYLKALRPDKMLVTVSAKGLKTTAVEPYFKVPYRLAPIAGKTVAQWRANGGKTALALPSPNPYIPDDLALKPLPQHPSREPRQILHRPGLSLWYQQAVDFRVPRAEYFVSVRSPKANDTATDAMLTKLYVSVLNDQLDAPTYPATLAGLDYDLYPHIRGFTLRISGYDDKQALLLKRVVAALRHPQITAGRFARVKDDLRRSLKSARLDQPYRQALRQVSELLLVPSWTIDQQLAALKPLTAGDLAKFVPKLLARLQLEILAYGNLTAHKARSMTAVLNQDLLAHAQPVVVPRGQVLKLSPDSTHSRELSIANNNSAVAVYFQGGQRSITERARFALLAQALDSPFFDQLRTEQRLGYIVFSTYLPMLEVPGLALVVQSPNTAPAALVSHIGQFLKQFDKTLTGMDGQRFAQIKASLRSRILTQDHTMADRAQFYWQELDRPKPDFEARQHLAAAVSAIGKTELLSSYQQAVLGKDHQQLRVEAPGQGRTKTAAAVGNGSVGNQMIRDRAAFRAGLKRFPD